MKTKRIIMASYAFVAMAGAAIMSSCSSNGGEYSYNPGMMHDNLVKDYQSAFVKKYGEISPYETWDLSQRGSTLAGYSQAAKTRGNDNGHGQNPNQVQNMSSHTSYGYLLNYSNNESTVANLFNKNWETIAAAIDAASEKDWNPSGKIVFSVVGVTRSASSNVKYYTWGIDTPSEDLFLRMSSPANGKDGKIGNSAENHTSSLDFSQIPTNARWFTASAGDKKLVLSDANNTTITKFKEATVTIDGTDYTFWGLACDVTNSNPRYTDMVLWVKKVSNLVYPVNSKRYMVEDLGGSYDFDFNDVVFDVIKYSDGSQKGYVRALGGTLDVTIKVAGNTWTKSQHYDFNEMLNTSNIDPNACLGEFDASGWDGNNSVVSVTVASKEDVTNGGDTQYYWAVPFPATGEAPLIVATMYGSKTWMPERKAVPDASWFQFSDVDLAE